MLYEPMFLLPYSLYLTYASVYMLELGVSEKQIGLLTSLGLILQIFTSLISGYLTDRMGRKRALMIFDLVSWSTATLLWACSQNIWFFLAAIIFNSFQKVPNTAWYCLLVEDTKPGERPHIFNALQLINIVCGLFAPLGGLLVSRLGLVPANRIMYLIAFVSMTLMFIFRNYATHETEIGLRKKREQGTLQPGVILRDYWQVVKMVFSSTPLLLIFGIYILYQFQLSMRNTYLSIYLVKALHFSEAFIAWFPAVTSVSMLLLILFVVPRIKSAYINRCMVFGFLLSAAAMLLQVMAPVEGTYWIVCSTILFAVGTIITYPYLEASVANVIQDEERAKVFSILSVMILLFVSPSGIIGGWSYAINPRLPFILIVCSFALSALLMIGFIRKQAAAAAGGSLSA
ncbi:MFS transporter [Paenibacillus piri]|uniref:MFS transporter n=2 Tax=Paenibacillus piri TaxID=2547395 RepID=A0A4R5KLX7_9BACL|nr:MFS transporter [Paenibacillus piri]